MKIPIYLLIERGLGWNLIRTVFASLDMVGFKLFSWLMQAVFDIASLSFDLVNQSVYDNLQQRVYVILGVFMLFKLTVSMLSYIVNPDKMNDKEQGISKIITRTIVSLCMLVSIPTIFGLLDRAQEPILEAVPRIILGKSITVDTITSQSESLGNKIAWTTYGLVFPIERAEGFNTVNAVPEHINEPGIDNSVYKYEYTPILGFVISVIMSFILLGICIDVAIRSFKLVILRMIAPIPIISYIDPKSSKDGMFQNYIKTLISTYIDLFIQVGILFFVLMMIDEILLQGGLTFGGKLSGVRGVVAGVFVIIGLLFFARQFPSFLKSALGIKNTKGLGVGLGGMLAAGGALLGGAGLAGAMTAGATAMNENADAAAQGKAGTASWSKGRDLAAQLRTGDKNAKGGAMNTVMDSMRKKAVKGAAGKRAASMGLSQSTLKTAKDEMLKLKNQAQVAAADYQNGVITAEEYQNILKKAGKAESNYNKANQAYSSMGLDSTWEEEHKMGAVDKVKSTYQAIRHPIQSTKNTVTDIPKKVTASVKDTLHIRNDSGDRYTGRSMDRIAEDAQSKNRDAFDSKIKKN